ncbi:MAG: M48 family metallopeptidase [Cycloclasticus sp.]|nr:M48 family metallopeptidase [Cycloclasticus sp.]
MTEIHGLLSDGELSKQLTARLYSDNGKLFQIDSEDKHVLFSMDGVLISPRIANTTRYISIADGLRFETNDNDAVDELQKKWYDGVINNCLHRLESHWKYAVVTVLLVILCGWAFIQLGLPGLAKKIAMATPLSINQSLASGALNVLDKWALSPSEIPAQRKRELSTLLKQVTPSDSDATFQLIFRKGNAVGANAFALPNGTIVFTDEIIQLSQNDDELVSVMAHEVGHVVQRHSLRRLVQDSGLAFMLLAVTGDVSSSSSLLLALPALLVEANYSQTFETEADQYALAYIQKNAIEGKHFLNLMKRLEAAPTKKSPSTKPVEQQSSTLDYFSSHPPTHERVKAFAAN